LAGNSLDRRFSNFVRTSVTGQFLPCSAKAALGVDSGNQLMMLFGLKRGVRPARRKNTSFRLWPWNYYFWTFVCRQYLIFPSGDRIFPSYEGVQSPLQSRIGGNRPIWFLLLSCLLAMVFRRSGLVGSLSRGIPAYPGNSPGYAAVPQLQGNRRFFTILFEQRSPWLGLNESQLKAYFSFTIF